MDAGTAAGRLLRLDDLQTGVRLREGGALRLLMRQLGGRAFTPVGTPSVTVTTLGGGAASGPFIGTPLDGAPTIAASSIQPAPAVVPARRVGLA
jgi:hypothetical protein